MIVPIKLVTVNANGKRYVYISQDRNKVKVHGKVERVAGFDAVYGPDKTFLLDRCTVTDVDLTEELLKELALQENA